MTGDNSVVLSHHVYVCYNSLGNYNGGGVVGRGAGYLAIVRGPETDLGPCLWQLSV